MKRNRKAKIVTTLGPASSSPEMIEKLFIQGTDVFRLNFSHGSIETHRSNIQHIRKLEKKYNHATCVLADLQGPKLRIGQFKNKGIVGGMLQANVDRMFKSEVGRNISKPAADLLKVTKHWNQKGLRGSKNPVGRQRQYIDGISGEINAPDEAVKWWKDGQVIKATNRLDLIIANSSSKLNGILKSKYGMES